MVHDYKVMLRQNAVKDGNAEPGAMSGVRLFAFLVHLDPLEDT